MVDQPEKDEKALKESERISAAIALEWPLSKLAANVLRIVRGAGKPHHLGRDCVDVVRALNNYIEAHGCLPRSETIQRMMSFESDRNLLSDEQQERVWALEKMTKGALQYAASTMLNQRPQIVAGEYEMIDGARTHEKFIDERNARWEAERVALQPKKGRRRSVL